MCRSRTEWPRLVALSVLDLAPVGEGSSPADALQASLELARLVEALGSPDFDARLAAIDELARVNGDNLGYFADGAEHERMEAVQKWKALLEIKPELEA